jgi:hypothetical protein
VIDGFSVEPAVARKAATICRNQVAFFVDILRRIDPCRVDDFGDCQMGRSLSHKFARKIAFDTTGIQRQLDFVWERLGLDVFPFPLECVRSGATGLERARLGTVVLDELRCLGVLDRAPCASTWKQRCASSPTPSCPSTVHG